MNPSALVFMALSWLFVLALNFFCFGRLIGNRKEKDDSR